MNTHETALEIVLLVSSLLLLHPLLVSIFDLYTVPEFGGKSNNA